MRRMMPVLVALALLGSLGLVCQAGDETAALVDKAIAAHGLKGKQDKDQGYRGKHKGTLHVANLDLEVEIVEAQFVDKLGDSEFAKPE